MEPSRAFFVGGRSALSSPDLCGSLAGEVTVEEDAVLWSILLVGVMVSGPMSQDPPSPAADINAAPTDRVASLLLSPELARNVVHHKATIIGMMPIPPGRTEAAARVELYTAAEGSGDHVCRRDMHMVMADRAEPSGLDLKPTRSPIPYIQIRLDDDCGGAATRRFATLDREMSEIEASPLLRRVGGLREDARAGRRPTVRVECLSELSQYRCPSDTSALLAELPLDGAYLIGRDRDLTRHPFIAATETAPGQAYWDVRLIDGAEPVLRLTRTIPAPF